LGRGKWWVYPNKKKEFLPNFVLNIVGDKISIKTTIKTIAVGIEEGRSINSYS
jgi:hypothetical protein